MVLKTREEGSFVLGRDRSVKRDLRLLGSLDGSDSESCSLLDMPSCISRVVTLPKTSSVRVSPKDVGFWNEGDTRRVYG